jgi:hypothetical protein
VKARLDCGLRRYSGQSLAIDLGDKGMTKGGRHPRHSEFEATDISFLARQP